MALQPNSDQQWCLASSFCLDIDRIASLELNTPASPGGGTRYSKPLALCPPLNLAVSTKLQQHCHRNFPSVPLPLRNA